MQARVFTPPKAEVCSPLEKARSQIGVTEEGPNNHGRMVKEYLASVGLPEGSPWCSAFVHWSYRQCGAQPEPARPYAMALEWHKKERRVWEKGGWKPDSGPFKRISKDGDHFAIWSVDLGRIGHTGMIHGEEEKYVLTTEGNTGSGGSRDGDGVYARKRLKSSLYCVSRWPVARQAP